MLLLHYCCVDGATLPGPANTNTSSSNNNTTNNNYVFNFDGNVVAAASINSSSSKAAHLSSHVTAVGTEEEEGSKHKRKKTENSHSIKSTDNHITPSESQFLPPANAHISLLSAAKVAALTQIPVTLLKAFNGGDIQKVRDIIKESTHKDCALMTPALDTELFGQNYICDFFESVYDSHPDAVWVAKKSKYLPERCEVNCRIYFAGTRIAQASKGTDLTGAYSEHLFERRGSSLLDEMDVSGLTAAERHAMKELESLGCNLSVFGKGNMTLLVDEQTGRITKFSCMWLITSFRQASF